MNRIKGIALGLGVATLIVIGLACDGGAPTWPPNADAPPLEKEETGVVFSPDPREDNRPPPSAERVPTLRAEDETIELRFIISGTVVDDKGGVLEGAVISARTEYRQALAEGNSLADGSFRLQLEVERLPVRILVEVSRMEVGSPTVKNARWYRVEGSGDLQLGHIVLPKVSEALLKLSGGVARSNDGSIEVHGVSNEITAVYARSFDPGESPDAFPGEFAEDNGFSLNSAVFAWISLLDNENKEVEKLSHSVILRVKVPRSQWGDLEDIDYGTGRVELPLYSFDQLSGEWKQEATLGWLEDERGTVLPEEAQPVVLDASYAGEVYATFEADHFSWYNIDYPYIGPWTLSRLSNSERSNPCFMDAVVLAEAIAMSPTGRNAFAKVNQPGVDLSQELAMGSGPEIAAKSLENYFPFTVDAGQYWGDAGGPEDQFLINSYFFDECGPSASAERRKDITLRMASTILHETAHWKDDVKLYPDDDTGTAIEEGTRLEKDIFGGDISGAPWGSGGLKLDGAPIPDSTRDFWLDPANWPPASGTLGGGHLLASPLFRDNQQEDTPLKVEISVENTEYSLGRSIPVLVTYTNVSDAAIKVMNRIILEGWPAHFNIMDDGGGRIRFVGPELEPIITDADFAILPPSGSLTLEVDLTKDIDRGLLHYQLLNPGTYQVTMVYEGFFRGIPEAVSNTLTIEVADGGRVKGTVSDAITGKALLGATVTAYQGGNFLDSTITDATGQYALPLPAMDPDGFGPYRLESRAHGYLRSVKEDVLVAPGVDTEVDFALSNLLATGGILAAGQLRIVLSYPPRDTGILLYPHLWLPREQAYHVDFSRQGSLEKCPGAEMTVNAATAMAEPVTLMIAELQPVSGSYLYAVNNYLRLTELEAKVEVFDSTGLLSTYQVPRVSSGHWSWWTVLEIDASDGRVRGINTLGADPTPYRDTGEGCG